LEEHDLILDGGTCNVGVESTIIDCTGGIPKILRPGAITAEMIQESTGLNVVWALETAVIRVSGSYDSHYAPAATVLLDQFPFAGQGFIAMADIATPAGVTMLAKPKTHEEFARVLYEALRTADEKRLQTVHVAQPKGDGIAIAIRDRLKRAAKSSGIADNPHS
jgi:L-threonylcarbamoyladenylate synthase